MKYRNIKNGNVIDIPSVLVDQEWEAVSEKRSPGSSSKSEKAVRANGGKKLRNSK
jgi:hypothetical protein